MRVGVDRPPREPGQVDGLAALEPPLARRERQQRVEQPLLIAARRQQFLAGGSEPIGARVRVGERDLDQRALERQRGAELVCGVCDEAALGGERALQPREQLVDRVAELLELVVGTGERQPLVQIARRDRPGRGRHLAQRAQDPPGREPAEQRRRRGGQRERDPRGGEQPVDVGGMLLGDDRVHRAASAQRRRRSG